MRSSLARQKKQVQGPKLCGSLVLLCIASAALEVNGSLDQHQNQYTQSNIMKQENLNYY